jgi:hypothetical protein
MDTSSTLRNYVFISYNHKDVKWAQWLQKKLEWYRLPTEIHNEFSDSHYIRPVFRDRDTLTSGVLNDELRNHLEASQYLVVLCSPNSAQSEWVSDEIKAFIEMGRLDKIVPFIIDGNPQDYSRADIRQPLMGECFPLALRKWNMEHPDKNLLGIAVTDDGKTDRQKAFIRVVAHLLGIGFDTLWQRHKRYIRRVIASLSVLAVIALALIYWFMIPVKVSVTIQDEHSNLPGMEHGILNIDGSEYSLSQPDTTIEINTLPGYYRLRSIPMCFRADRFYLDEVEPLKIGKGISQHVTLKLHRDSTFAVFAGTVYDGDFEDYDCHPVEGAQITIGKYETVSDENGQFRIGIPLEEQEEVKPVAIKKQDYESYQRDDESPSKDLKYLLHR